MRFAGANPAISAIGSLYSGYDPGLLSGTALRGRSLQKQTAMKTDAALRATKNEADAMIEAAEYGASATRSAGQAAGTASLVSGIASGISSFAGPIASKLNTPNLGVPRTSPGKGIPGSVAPSYQGNPGRPYYGPAF